MNRNRKKIRGFSIAVAVLLLISIIYRAFIIKDRIIGRIPKEANGKDIVSVTLKKSYYSDRIGELIKDYNKNSRDTHIIYNTYDKDYYNMLRLSMLTQNKPDIFQFGYYDFLKNGQLLSLRELGYPVSESDRNRVFSYMGEPMGIKVAGSTAKFAWNKEIFEKSGLDPNKGPETWEDVIAYSEKIKKAFPGIIPFEFPAHGNYDLIISLGQNSVNMGSITTNFWDYKKGAYDYSYAKPILDIYTRMYKMNLIPKNFDEKDRSLVRQDFADKKTAIIISTYDDKISFLTDTPLNFETGISDLPVIQRGQTQDYYLEDVTTLVAAKNKDLSSGTKKVYDWLVSTAFNKDNSDVLRYKSNETSKYGEYDNASNFRFEENDPTQTMDIDVTGMNKSIYDAVRGNISIDDAVEKLDKYINGCVEAIKKTKPDYFEGYIDRSRP